MGMYGHETTQGVIKPFYVSTPLKSQKSKHNIIVSLLGNHCFGDFLATEC